MLPLRLIFLILLIIMKTFQKQLVAAFVIAGACSIRAYAETATEPETVLTDEIQVTASRVPTPLAKAPRIIGIMTAEQVKTMPVQSINDIVKYAAGVDVRQRGPIGAQTDVGIRGGNFEQVAILLDGINICDPQSGHNSFDFPVDINDIDHIEILEGPAGRIYGSSSLMGAINIVTKNSANSSADVHTEAGSFGYASAGFRANIASGGWNNQISSTATRSDGYSRSKAGTLNSDFKSIKAFYRGTHTDNDVIVNWHAGVSSKDFGSNTFYSAKYDDQFEHTFKTFAALQAENRSEKFHIHPSIWWNHSEDRFELMRGVTTPVPFNYHKSDVTGISVNSYFDWFLGHTSVGGEIKNENLVSGNLGEPLSNPENIPGTDRQYTLGLNRTNISFIAEHNLTLGRFNLSAGAIAAKNTWNGNRMKIYPGADLSFTIADGLKAYASYNTSLRMPSVTELYYSVGGYKADKHLKPEELEAFELGLKYNGFNGIQATASVYRHNCTNMIDWIMDITLPEASRIWESVNFTEIRSTGAELSLNLDMDHLISSQEFLKNINVAYNYINQEKVDIPGIQSRSTLEYLRHKLVAGISFNIYSNLDLGLNYRYQDRKGTFSDANGIVHDFEPYSLVDARLQWNDRSYKLFVEANNLFDKSYYDYGCVPQPGTWVMAGAQFSLDF